MRHALGCLSVCLCVCWFRFILDQDVVEVEAHTLTSKAVAVRHHHHATTAAISKHTAGPVCLS